MNESAVVWWATWAGLDRFSMFSMRSPTEAGISRSGAGISESGRFPGVSS